MEYGSGGVTVRTVHARTACSGTMELAKNMKTVQVAFSIVRNLVIAK